MGRVLVVRHAPGQARMDHYLQHVLDDIEHDDPGLFRQLEFHQLGAPVPSLDDARAVVFFLPDPLRERHPEMFHDARRVADAARERDVPLVNAPEDLEQCAEHPRASVGRQRDPGSCVDRVR